MSEPRIIISSEAAMNDGMDQPEVERQLSIAERLWNNAALRKGLILIVLALIWEVYARHLDNVLLFPTLTDTLKALYAHLIDGSLLDRVWTSLKVLLIGYAVGIALAGVLTGIAINTRIGTDLLETLTAMFNPLPAIALLPLALIWFGLGMGSLVFVLVHSVLWAVALNTHAGFLSVSPNRSLIRRMSLSESSII